MTPLQLVLAVKRCGVSFLIQSDGTLIMSGAERVPDQLRQKLLNCIEDCRAVIREHSLPTDINGANVVDAARQIVIRERKPMASAQRAAVHP